MNSDIRKEKKKIVGSKPFIIGGLIGVFAVAGIVGGIVFLSSQRDEQTEILIIGVPWKPILGFWSWILDPSNALYPIDYDVIQQVGEALFSIDTTSHNSEIIPNLAIWHNWSIDALNLTCFLRQDVKFHDGTTFNAAAVKWNFDRIHRLIDEHTYPELWRFPDGSLIINKTVILGEYTVRFILNAPYVPLLNLLASPYAAILSPTATPSNEFINDQTGTLVGTGPFIFESYEYNYNISLSANPHYWSRKPDIDKLIFIKINSTWDGTPEIQALQAGEINLLKDVLLNETSLDWFSKNNSFAIQETLLPNLRWFPMNNKRINTTMRKAFSYALNYSAINQIMGEKTVRAESPIPESMLYHNTGGIKVPYYNLTIARQILIDAGIPGTTNLTANDNSSTGNEWEVIANSGNPLATYNYSYILDTMGTISANFSNTLTENFKQIGVKLIPVGISFAVWFFCIKELNGYHRDMLEITWDWWRADFNDPSNFINPFFTNQFIAENVAQVDDITVQQWMDLALSETEPFIREQLYYQIQKRLIEEIYPHLWVASSFRYSVFSSNLEGWHPNPFITDFKSVNYVQ